MAGVPRYQLRTTYGTTSSLSLRFSATLLDRRVGVSRPLGSWCPTALQIVLTWGMAPLLARCHEGQLSLKFDCVFVPVDFMHCASYGFPFIDLLYSVQCNSEDVSFSILFVGNAGHFDAVIDLAQRAWKACSRFKAQGSSSYVAFRRLTTR